MNWHSLIRGIALAAFITAALTASVCARTAEKINHVACNAFESGNYSDKMGVIKLYGIRTNGPDTKNGRLACAKVATIILKKAGVTNKISLGVRHVEEALKDWKKIRNEDDLKPGDVIVWINRFTGRPDERCTGGGNCHVGIVTENGYFHNSPITNTPTFGGVSLWGFRFKVGFRPPD
ncbi:MAG: hypothetical protein PVG41_05220 [Desulfobacteraceae bacterium]|jgi:hypothetical protein